MKSAAITSWGFVDGSEILQIQLVPQFVQEHSEQIHMARDVHFNRRAIRTIFFIGERGLIEEPAIAAGIVVQGDAARQSNA